MKELLIVGAGDLGKEIVWLIEDINKQCPTYLIIGFLDDDKECVGKELCGYKILGTTDLLEKKYNSGQVGAVIAIKDGKNREKIVEKYASFNGWETVVHPNAVIASSSKVGRGSIVFPNVTVSVDTVIGDFTLLYIHSVVLNDSKIGKYVSVMANTTVLDHKMIPDKTEVKK